MSRKDVFLGTGWRFLFWIMVAIYCFLGLLFLFAMLFIDYSKNAETAGALGFFAAMSAIYLSPFLIWFGIMALIKQPPKKPGKLDNGTTLEQSQPVETKVEKSVTVEDEAETFKHITNKCPYCSSTSVSEHIVEGPLSESDMQTYGYYYKWECQCSDCGSRWFGIE